MPLAHPQILISIANANLIAFVPPEGTFSSGKLNDILSFSYQLTSTKPFLRGICVNI